MYTQQTRRESNRKVDRTTRYQQILQALDRPMTAREIANKLGFSDMNAVRPRVTELRQMGRIQEAGTKYDRLTGRNVALFERMEDE